MISPEEIQDFIFERYLDMKKILICLLVSLVAFASLARPQPPPRHHHRPPVVRHHNPPPKHHRHHHHDSRTFWGALGLVTGIGLVNEVMSTPRVVVTPTPHVIHTTPTYVTQQVWVEGRYVDQVQPNGTVIRVWQPGHYEVRQIPVTR